MTEPTSTIHVMPDPDSCSGMAPTSACCYYPRCSCGWEADHNAYVYSEKECIAAWQRHVDNIMVPNTQGPIIGRAIEHPICDTTNCNEIAHAKVTWENTHGVWNPWQFCKMHCPEFATSPEQEQPVRKTGRQPNPLISN